METTGGQTPGSDRAASRGRPRANAAKSLPETLLNAARKQLSGKSHLEMTSRDIAQAAGADASMINYYFHGKDGLLFELVDDICIEAMNRLHAVERQIDLGAEDPIELFLRAQITAVERHGDVLTVIFIELLRPDSPIKRAYADRQRRREWNLIAHTQRIIGKIIARYERSGDIDPMATAWTFMCLVYGPLLIRAVWDANASMTKKPDRETWISQTCSFMRAFFQIQGLIRAAA